MKKWLQKIREKNEVEKTIFAFFSALSITAVIFVVWLFLTIHSFQNIKQTESVASPIESLKEQFNSLFNNK